MRPFPPWGHKTELRNAKEATCTEDGYTGDEVCTVCGETVKEGQVIPANCPSKAFADLNTDRWYHEYTDYVIAKGLMNGMDETHFAPEGSLTRGQLVTTLYRLAGEPEVAEPATFADVKAGRYYTEAVAWAEENGIAKGITDTTFCPDKAVTREQAATFPVPLRHRIPGAGTCHWGGPVHLHRQGSHFQICQDRRCLGNCRGPPPGLPRVAPCNPEAPLTRAQMAKP